MQTLNRGFLFSFFALVRKMSISMSEATKHFELCGKTTVCFLLQWSCLSSLSWLHEEFYSCFEHLIAFQSTAEQQSEPCQMHCLPHKVCCPCGGVGGWTSGQQCPITSNNTHLLIQLLFQWAPGWDSVTCRGRSRPPGAPVERVNGKGGEQGAFVLILCSTVKFLFPVFLCWVLATATNQNKYRTWNTTIPSFISGC